MEREAKWLEFSILERTSSVQFVQTFLIASSQLLSSLRRKLHSWERKNLFDCKQESEVDVVQKCFPAFTPGSRFPLLFLLTPTDGKRMKRRTLTGCKEKAWFIRQLLRNPRDCSNNFFTSGIMTVRIASKNKHSARHAEGTRRLTVLVNFAERAVITEAHGGQCWRRHHVSDTPAPVAYLDDKHFKIDVGPGHQLSYWFGRWCVRNYLN